MLSRAEKNAWMLMPRLWGFHLGHRPTLHGYSMESYSMGPLVQHTNEQVVVSTARGLMNPSVLGCGGTSKGGRDGGVQQEYLPPHLK